PKRCESISSPRSTNGGRSSRRQTSNRSEPAPGRARDDDQPGRGLVVSTTAAATNYPRKRMRVQPHPASPLWVCGRQIHLSTRPNWIVISMTDISAHEFPKLSAPRYFSNTYIAFGTFLALTIL